ncbi:MAG: glycosyltransferase family 4 protein [Candidatus Nanohaloarchaea archaeon]
MFWIKKICFIHPHGYNAFEKDSVGGTQLQLYFLSTELAKDDEFEVTFITRGVDGTEEREGVELVQGIGDVDSWTNKLRTGFELLSALDRVDADLYFSSSSNMIPGVVSPFCKLKGRKHIHRTVHERQLDGSLLRNSPLKGIFNYLGLKTADFIFAQCREHSKALSEWFTGDIEVLPNSFPMEDRATPGGDYVLWVGRRVEWKRPDLVLDLASEFSSEDFVVISPRTSSTEEFYDRIEERASQLPNVELIERVPREEIQDFFDDAKVFVNTSEKEGFPNTFVEAGKGATPILSYRVDPDGFIEEEECGYSCNGDYPVLEERLEQMLSNKDETRQQGENCRSYVERHHSLSKNVRKVKQAITSLLED